MCYTCWCTYTAPGPGKPNGACAQPDHPRARAAVSVDPATTLKIHQSSFETDESPAKRSLNEGNRRTLGQMSSGDARPASREGSRPIRRWCGTRSTTSCRWRDRARTWAGTGGCRRASGRAGVSPSSGSPTEAQDALRAEDAGPAASALEQLIDLACEAHDYDYFRSDDPVAAAGFVVSDVAAVLWASIWERHGFQTFAETAAPQLVRWESTYGWTRYGEGSVAAKETSLAVVLARMLRVPDTWEGFAEQYVLALDEVSRGGASTRRIRHSAARTEQERASALAEWHGLLLENLADTEGGLLDRIATHAALGGPEQTFLSARLAHRRGNTDVARDLVARCLRKLPGHKDFRDFAAEIGATAPCERRPRLPQAERGAQPVGVHAARLASQ